ncbi:4-coumarate--CoA ligase-like 9 [Humulus lupulus]|uniref:4-coumarate--CoA ligase-like 9 n=1 Tax=Humulus lupulus TaxID=3486 RepID=UPI002B4158FB|nr:4-coumarate--CoA ligase-like 9 [Humulus lupulus]
MVSPKPNPVPAPATAPAIDPNSGFCSETRTYHSLRPNISLPPEMTPLSVVDYLFSHLHSSPPPPSTPALVDAATHRCILYPDFTQRVRTLASSIQTRLGISTGDAAFVLSPNSLHIPILYYSLLSLGVVVSPANPASTTAEISRLIQLCKPIVAFATTESAEKLPSLRYGTVLLDSDEFESMMTTTEVGEFGRVEVNQSDTATILYSSGTTGLVKGVELTHRNWISVLAGAFAVRRARTSPAVGLCAVPFFHVYGFGYCVRTIGLGDTLVTMGKGRFDLNRMLRTIEELRVTQVALAPPAVAAVVNRAISRDGYGLSSLEAIACGGAPLPRSIIVQLRTLLPNVQLLQGYGLTESTGRVFAAVGLKESRVEGSTGKLVSNFIAKIVDPENGAAIGLPPLTPGELWLKGPFVMKGYVGDKEATAAVVDSEGWLKTGDLCYIDNEGYLFIVDRLKELIKYKGYQVAPAELEHLLQSHPDVIDAAVVPYPDEEAGQLPMAFVVKRPGSVAHESLIMDFIKEKVAPYKRIRKLRFIDAIPRNAQGKVLRRDLIKLASSSPPTSKL